MLKQRHKFKTSEKVICIVEACLNWFPRTAATTKIKKKKLNEIVFKKSFYLF